MGGPFDWFHWTDIEIDRLVILGCSKDTADTIEVEGSEIEHRSIPECSNVQQQVLN